MDWDLPGKLSVYVCVLLLSGNLFFVKRMVDEIDETKSMVIALHEKVEIINARIGLGEKNVWELPNENFGTLGTPVRLKIPRIEIPRHQNNYR